MGVNAYCVKDNIRADYLYAVTTIGEFRVALEIISQKVYCLIYYRSDSCIYLIAYLKNNKNFLFGISKEMFHKIFRNVNEVGGWE
jgi:hypothetical protein